MPRRPTIRWFKHDTDAYTDAKIRKLIMKHGAVGYAVYFHCLELIAGDVSDKNITFELEHDSEVIADNLKITGTSDKAGIDIVNDIMRYMIAAGLFELSGSRITCMKLFKRLDSSMTSNSKLRSLLTKVRVNKQVESHDPIMISHDTISKSHARLDNTRQDSKSVAYATHPTLTIPINQSRYDTLVGEYGKPMVDTAIQERLDWESANGKTPAKDYAAAAANWLKKAKEFGNLPEPNDGLKPHRATR